MLDEQLLRRSAFEVDAGLSVTRTTVGVVGYGYWGPNLVRNLAESTQCRIKYVCDKIDANLRKAKLSYPFLTVTPDFSDLINDPELDAVILAVPVNLHYPLAKQALEAGKHVMIEKPLTSDSAHAEELIRIAGERGLVLMVGHTFEYSAPVVKVKQIIDSGDLGDILYITSKRVNLGLYQGDVSVIWDLGPHDLSILLYWLGEQPSKLSAFGRACMDTTKPDVAFLSLAFPSGIIAELQLSWLSPIKLRRTLVVGSKKMLLYDDTEAVEVVKIFDHGVGHVKEPKTFGEFKLTCRTGDIVSPRLEAYEPLAAQISHFLECVVTGATPRTDGESGLRVVRALEAADRSWEQGGGFIEVGQLTIPTELTS